MTKPTLLVILVVLAGCQVSVPLDLPWNVDAVESDVDAAGDDTADGTVDAPDTQDVGDAQDAPDVPDATDVVDTLDVGSDVGVGEDADAAGTDPALADTDAALLDTADVGVDVDVAAPVDAAGEVTSDTGAPACDPAACPDDGNACTTAACDMAGACTQIVNTGTCSDGSACTQGDTCAQGSCIAGVLLTCDDSSACTSDSCDNLTGCVHSALSCADDITCTTDTCDPSTGCTHLPYAGICDDGNPCTDTGCDLALGCTSTFNTASCDDKNACTSGDVCSAGTCVGQGATPCDDADACTTDPCDASTGCKHGLVGCDDGIACTADSCDSTKGCVHSPQDGACDDGVVCTDDACSAGNGCVHLTNAASCDDGDACTVNDTCAAQLCGPGGAKNCDDSNACTIDSCDKASGCVNAAITCTDGIACTTDSCSSTIGCVFTPNDATCTDGNDCTDDACDLASGCKHIGNTKPCDDGNACTSGDSCLTFAGASNCLGTPIVVATVCDDGNPCTTDTCDKTNGCTYAPKANTPCDDSNPCTQNDTCNANAVCVSGQNICGCQSDGDCVQSGNLCTGLLYCDKAVAPYYCKIDPKTVVKCDTAQDGQCKSTACEPGNGKCVTTNLADNKACDADGSICTVSDACLSGTCTAGAALPCDDNNPCTTDACDAKDGCTNTNNALACTDGKACTVGDVCSGGLCIAGSAKVCNDDNACTADSCDAVTGSCVFDMTALQNTGCTDGNACTTFDVCTAGVCAGIAIVCTASDQCHDVGTCSAGTCSNPAKSNASGCNDGNGCTTSDACTAGTCAGTLNCDDGNNCTDDNCVGLACVHPANAAVCSDGNACTVGDVCANSTCSSGPAALGEWVIPGATFFQDVTPTSDGGFVAVGGIGSKGYVVRLDSAGNTVWSYTTPGIAYYSGVCIGADGTIFVVGGDDGSGWRATGVAFSSTGTVKWQRVWTVSGSAIEVFPRDDGSLRVVGQNMGTSPRTAWWGSVSSTGVITKQVALSTRNDQLNHVSFQINGTQTLTVGVEPNYGNVWWSVLDDSGGKLRSGSVVVPATWTGIGGCALDAKGRLLCVGESSSAQYSGYAGWGFQLDASGSELWKGPLWGALPSNARLSAATMLSGGDAIVAGEGTSWPSASANIGFARLENASTLGQTSFPYGTPGKDDHIYVLRQLPSGVIVAAGQKKSGTTTGGVILRMDPWFHTTCQAAGTCLGQAANGCDDGVQCTSNVCDASAGCSHAALTAGSACDDGNACTSADTCTAGTCKSGGAVTCAANATCDSSSGCVCNAGFSGSGVSGGTCACGNGIDGPGIVTAITTAAGSKNVCAYDWPVWGNRPDSPNTYTNNGDGTVSDSQTKLMWQQTTIGTYTWAAAMTYCDGLTLAGHDDWRLPTVAEGESLIDYAQNSPSISTVAFPSAAAGEYWTSIVSAYNSAFSWVSGLTTTAFDTRPKSGSQAVRCVRSDSGWLAPTPRFVVSGSNPNATVQDNATGLVWQQTLSGEYAWSAASASGSAQAYCASLSLNGYASGWRLPSMRELVGLADRTLGPPSINATAFPNTPSTAFWSSTPGTATGTAWYVQLGLGNSNNVGGGNLSSTYSARCVH